MPNTYTWLVDSLDCIPSSDGKSNVVSNVHWRVNAISDQNYVKTLLDGTTQTLPYSSTIHGTQSLTYNSENSFIDYSNLTKDTVIGWIQSAMGSDQVSAIQSILDNQIANLINPKIGRYESY